MIFRALLAGVLGLAALLSRASPDLVDLWKERVNSVVAIEFFTETELDRHSTQTFGTVIDDQGTIIFPTQAIGAGVSPDQLKDFRVYRPGEPASRYAPAEYLGPDEYTGWEFIRVRDSQARASLIPITRYAVSATPQITEELWGIGLRKKDEDFAPYFMSGRVSIVQRLPQHTALAAQEVAGLGLPVFTKDGSFVGLSIGGFGQTYLQFSARDRGGMAVVLVNPDECAAVVLADEILPNLNRIPQRVTGRPLAWLGTNGLQPLDPEVARYLNLENRAGLVVSDVLEDSPAALAGVLERDIILSFDGQLMPVLKPDRVLISYFQREVDRRRPGAVMMLGVRRGGKELQLKVTLQDAPMLPREAPKRFFEGVGLTVRVFTYSDGVARRLRRADHIGVIAHFVKPNAPASTAGLRTEDWIKEIDGVVVTTFPEAEQALERIENDPARAEFILLVNRGGETEVLRVKLK